MTAAGISSPDELTDLAARLARAERREAALAGVLRAVAEGGDDLESVLFDIAQHALALTGGVYANVLVVEDGKIAAYGATGNERPPKAFREHSDVSALTEVLRDRNVLRFEDQSTLGDEYAQSREAALRMQTTSAVYVPLPTSGAPLGIYVARREIDPFTDEEVELLQSFAVQAGNAVTTAQQRREVAEALKLQTATSEVLRLISAHPGDLPTTTTRPGRRTGRAGFGHRCDLGGNRPPDARARPSHSRRGGLECGQRAGRPRARDHRRPPKDHPAQQEAEVDFGWPNDRVALEVSPFFTHGSRVTQDRDAERRRLLAAATWRVVEAVDADLANERAFARFVATLRATGLT